MKFVGYIRVSTKQQGDSGLGLAAQQTTLDRFAAQRDGQIIRNFIEVESGKKANRTELTNAIKHAQENKAILLVAKLDRLSRNVKFLADLMESRTQFQCCDMPVCDNFTIHLFAALAEKETAMISHRTKAALEAKKAQGFTLGKNNLTDDSRRLGHQAKREIAAANENNRRATEMIKVLRPAGQTFRAIAETLNKGGFATSTGRQFTGKAVQLLWIRWLGTQKA